MPYTAVTPLDPRRTINGREGKVFMAGSIFLAWVESIEARITIDRADVVVSGRRGTGYKPTGVSGTGTLNGFHTTSRFRKMVADYMGTIAGTPTPFPDPTYLVMELSDPDQWRDGANGTVGSPMVEQVRLERVNFWEAPLGFDTGSLVMDDIPFTFEGVDFEQVISPQNVLY